MDINQVYPGFSRTNRWLLYANIMLAPAQYVSGIGNNCPSNIGFLAYNWYTQVYWYRAIRSDQLHALSMLPVHFNTILAMSYLGGVSSGNYPMAILASLGTAGVLIFNTVAAWTSWATYLPEGYGKYQFFFFGWRTLTPGWRKFFLVWQIADSMEALTMIFIGFALSIYSLRIAHDFKKKHNDWRFLGMTFGPDVWKYPTVFLGPILALFIAWPLILWTELIVARNHIESETDMVAVWLFVAQIVTMLVPSCGINVGWRRDKSPDQV